MSKKIKTLFFLGSFVLLILLGEMYLKNNENMIKKNLKLGTAHIYSTDTKTRYGHFRIWYEFKTGSNRIDSSHSIRDDLDKTTFSSLKNQNVEIVFDSTNAIGYNALLITNNDYLKYGIKRPTVRDVSQGIPNDR